MYVLLALFGLGFLVLIHELGHYWMAKRVGMKVESFGIGFGKPIFSFEWRQVKWNICWLPFGGYVKIAGMEDSGKKDGPAVDLQSVPGGFFAKSPWDRMLVAFAGPLVNIFFAFFVFAMLWMSGGREKNFADVTSRVGWVDPSSELYYKGLRPGDEITSYNHRPVHGGKDHFQAAMIAAGRVHVEGRRIDPTTGQSLPFEYDIRPYPHPLALERGILTTGVLAPAGYVVYDRLPGGRANPIPDNSPLYGSAIQYGDRIVWMDGERIYSLAELTNILNDGRSLLTVERDGKYLLRRVPRVAISELKLTPGEREEVADWQWEAGLKGRLPQLFFVPYQVNSDGVVEERMLFVDRERERATFPNQLYSEREEPLQPGDRIVAVDGRPVQCAHQIMGALQTKQVQLVVERAPEPARLSWREADQRFDSEVSPRDLAAIATTIGTDHPLLHSGSLVLLPNIVPKTRTDLFQGRLDTAEQQYLQEIEEEKQHIQAIDDPEKRQQALNFLEHREQQLLLGLPGVQDLHVNYNPNPVAVFDDVTREVSSTLSALLGGYLNPKWISGPIGIVQVIHSNWMVGIKEALFWIGTISLNLGLLNLLPLPVLDGGYICLSLFEILSGQRVKPKLLEKVVVPFAVLFMAFLVYLTYNDISRLVSQIVR